MTHTRDYLSQWLTLAFKVDKRARDPQELPRYMLAMLAQLDCMERVLATGQDDICFAMDNLIAELERYEARQT